MQFLDDIIDPEEYTFGFGKYRGWGYLELRDHDPFYIQWCAESIDWFKLTKDEKDYIDQLCDEQTRNPNDPLDFS